MPFQIHALPADTFAPLFAMTDAQLSQHKACRQIVTQAPGTPCRISLRDAAVGETVILANHVHQPADSPYQAAHAIFVRQDAVQAQLAVGEVPDVIAQRLMSLRLFDKDHMMIDADVMAGDAVAAAITEAFKDARVSYAHLHNAKPGCFAAAVSRAGEAP